MFQQHIVRVVKRLHVEGMGGAFKQELVGK